MPGFISYQTHMLVFLNPFRGCHNKACCSERIRKSQTNEALRASNNFTDDQPHSTPTLRDHHHLMGTWHPESWSLEDEVPSCLSPQQTSCAPHKKERLKSLSEHSGHKVSGCDILGIGVTEPPTPTQLSPSCKEPWGAHVPGKGYLHSSQSGL